MAILSIRDFDLNQKRLLIRVDFNVPMSERCIVSDVRIQAAMPTIRYALDHGAAVILISHLGRPQEGIESKEFSLEPIAAYLSNLLPNRVRFEKNWLEGLQVQAGEVVLCENVRFNVGEKANDKNLAEKMARLCDIFVMDAFGTAHRAEASTVGVAKFAPIACAGLLLKAELDALGKALFSPRRPVVAIVGGSKVSTKLTVLKNLIDKVDTLIVGGGIANTFLAAQGYSVGRSLYEPELLAEAKLLMEKMHSKQGQIPLPEDVRTAKEFSKNEKATVKSITEVTEGEMILDIGPLAAEKLKKVLLAAGTIIWNGPLGVFEFPEFSEGTREVATAIAKSTAFSLAGGGDTIAAIDLFNLQAQISYISTGGGAFLEYVEGKILPAVEILHERATQH